MRNFALFLFYRVIKEKKIEMSKNSPPIAGAISKKSRSKSCFFIG